MATKNLYGKRSGVYYYHYEQSFAPGEIKDYDTAHKIGLRLAEEMFPGFEVLVGTHLDAHDDDGRQRVHNHFVINSVSYASGMKLDYGPYTIEKMRRISDRLCEEHALSVLPEFKQTFDGKSISTREYRAALKGDSWKFKAICTIENTLGKYFMDGKHVKKDIAKAIEHLEIASARGNMYADYRLAQIYLFEADIFDMEKALEYLNRSAHAGNESAALALTRMANNQFLAVATNVLDLVGSLASIESYRQPQDCTTMPISRKERKKHEWEQSM